MWWIWTHKCNLTVWEVSKYSVTRTHAHMHTHGAATTYASIHWWIGVQLISKTACFIWTPIWFHCFCCHHVGSISAANIYAFFKNKNVNHYTFVVSVVSNISPLCVLKMFLCFLQFSWVLWWTFIIIIIITILIIVVAFYLFYYIYFYRQTCNLRSDCISIRTLKPTAETWLICYLQRSHLLNFK